ncbi:Uncharacterised protein [Vibrio cholerae]|nr:Uncharacterised protein [Vibrio cholerae]
MSGVVISARKPCGHLCTSGLKKNSKAMPTKDVSKTTVR